METDLAAFIVTGSTGLRCSLLTQVDSPAYQLLYVYLQEKSKQGTTNQTRGPSQYSKWQGSFANNDITFRYLEI